MPDFVASPLVTVIIPTYNAEKYVAQAVDSVLSQQGVPVEVIVIDDGSTDGTLGVLESFGSRIQVVRQNRGGPYRARNLGAQMAKGSWIALLDADDDWLPGKLAAQLAIADDKTDFVYTDRHNFGDFERTTQRQSDSVKLWDGDVFVPLLMGNFITLSSVLIRKTAFDALGGFQTARRGVQDWDLWLRYAASGRLVRLCPEALTRYRFHGEQMTNDLDQRAADRESVLRTALESERGRKLPSATAKQALANAWSLAGWHAVEFDRGKAVSCYLKAASYWPWSVVTYKNIVKAALGRT